MLAEVDTFAVIVTAPGREVDFVSRFFAPRAGIDEDPVTGSAHSHAGSLLGETLAPACPARSAGLSPRGGAMV